MKTDFKVIYSVAPKEIEEKGLCVPDLEEAVLGAIIMEQDAVTDVIDILSPKHFYIKKNRWIYEAIMRLFNNMEPIDARTLLNQLRRDGTLEKVGGLPYILGITESIIATKHIRHHALLLGEYSLRRELLETCASIVKETSDKTEDIFDVYSNAEKKILAISERTYGGVSDWDCVIARARERQKQGEECTPTGYEALDSIIGGWKGGHLVVIGARPGTGKSALIGNMAYEAVRQGVPVAIFSLEMPESEIFPRLISIQSGILIEDIIRGNWLSSTQSKVEEANALFSKKIFISDKAALEIDALKSMCRRLVKQCGVRVAFVDYLQLMTVANMPKNTIREQVIAAISRGLKSIAQDLNITIVAAAQVNRAAGARIGDKRPQLHDLRESGAIEQDADKVMMLYRPSGCGEDGLRGRQDITELIVAKNRAGKKGTVKLKFAADCCKFTCFDPVMDESWSGG